MNVYETYNARDLLMTKKAVVCSITRAQKSRDGNLVTRLTKRLKQIQSVIDARELGF